MMMKWSKRMALAGLALAAGLVLAACGGGSSGGAAKEVSPAVGTWVGQYTKFVGDSDEWRDTSDEFSLVLNADGKGTHSRDGMEFEVTWKLDGENFTMDEKFIGDPIVYTGTLSGDDLNIFNGEPDNDFTCEYVYVREGGTSAKTAAPAAAETVEETEAEDADADDKSASVSAQAAAGGAGSTAGGDVGKYVIYEYEAGGSKVSHDMLLAAGMGDTYLELKEDGTGELFLYNSPMELTWEDGKITVYGTSQYGYEIDGDTLFLDMQGVSYVMLREGSDAAKATGTSAKTAAGASGNASGGDDGIYGTYYLSWLGDMSIEEFADLAQMPVEEAAEMMKVEIRDDGTLLFIEDGEPEEIAYTLSGDQLIISEDGEELVMTVADGQLIIEEDGEKIVYSMTRPGTGAASGGQSSVAASGSANAAAASAAATSAGAPAGVPGGDGIVSEAEVQKAYVWLHDVVSGPFSLTYEDLRDHFGVDGEFDKEEYSDHMQMNMRYYKWISEDDHTHFLYVNFQEKDAENEPGVYKVSGYNSSGFTGSMAAEKYLDEVRAEATAASKAAAANMKMKEFDINLELWGNDDVKLTVHTQIPESGWSYNERKNRLIEAEDPDTYGAGFIEAEIEETVEKFDYYKDDFKNYQEIGTREIGGLTFQGRTYTNIGYDYTEYLARIDEDCALSIRSVGADIEEGTVGGRIIDAMTFERK